MKNSFGSLRALVHDKLEGEFALGSIIFLLYALSITWQYCGVIGYRPLAWTLAFILAVMVCGAYIALSDPSTEKLPWQFWLIVALPLLAIYGLRVDFPDVSFDVVNYHIFESERILRGSLYLPMDFFPGSLPVNPTPDVLAGLSRHLLGYRLGTVINYVALIWTGVILNRVLRAYIHSTWLRSLSVLFILLSEQMLFQINNYMVDLLALPLLLEATLVAMEQKAERILQRTMLLSLLLGIAIAFKLSNLFIAAPIVVVYVVNVLTSAEKQARLRTFFQLLKLSPIAAIIFLAPVAPFSFVMYRLTGNPIFPLYNGIFKSPFWPQGAPFDPRWGPPNLYETIIWPVVMLFHPERLSECPYYSGRLTLGFILAAVCLIVGWRDRTIRYLAFIILSGTILWSASSGYIRYALYLELISGIVIIWLAAVIWQRLPRNTWRVLAPLPLWLLMLGQGYYALRYVMHWEWSQRQPVTRRDEYFRNEYEGLLRDHSFRSYISDEELALFNNVDVWIETTYKTSAFEVLLRPDVPIIAVRMPNFFETNVARSKFGELIQAAEGKRMFTLTTRESIDEARQSLAARGLAMGTMRTVSLNYFSDALKFEVFLAEIHPTWTNSGSTEAVKGVPMPDMAFKAQLAIGNLPTVMHAGQTYVIPVKLTNNSKIAWPGRQETWQFQLTIGNKWVTPTGQLVTNIDGRTALAEDLAPGKTVELPLTVKAPSAPGDYILQLDAIQEGVAWFGDRGSELLSLKIRVQ
jgi:hypothetical protein